MAELAVETTATTTATTLERHAVTRKGEMIVRVRVRVREERAIRRAIREG